MQNVAKFRLLRVFSTSAQYVQIVANMSTFCVSAQYVRMSLKEPLMNKSCPKWLFLGLFRCKQTFSQNVAKFLLIEGLLVPQPSTYE